MPQCITPPPLSVDDEPAALKTLSLLYQLHATFIIIQVLRRLDKRVSGKGEGSESFARISAPNVYRFAWGIF